MSYKKEKLSLGGTIDKFEHIDKKIKENRLHLVKMKVMFLLFKIEKPKIVYKIIA